MKWCQWCSNEAKYDVASLEVKSTTVMHACGRHLGRAVDFRVEAGGRVEVTRLKS